MPEGDTIHRLAASLRADLCGHVLLDARADGRRLEACIGTEVADVFAVGKHLFVHAGPLLIRSHLGMHGEWRRYRPAQPSRRPAWAARVRFARRGMVLACFRTREVEVLDPSSPRLVAVLRGLGPDPLGADFEVGACVQRSRSLLAADTPLVDVLLDQRVAAGIGNVYKNELLFLLRLHPETAQRAVGDDRLAALFSAAAAAMRGNLASPPGPRRLRPGGAGDPALWVYGRRGEPCFACGARIEFGRCGRGRRATWWCPRCQAPPAVTADRTASS